MSQEFRVASFGELATLLRSHARIREQRVHTGIRKAAREGRNYIYRETVPVAFGELRSALNVRDTATGAIISADAPHAAAVERGSRPHTPPLEPLIKWVKLRGMQGLTRAGHVISRHVVARDWRKSPARIVASQLKSSERSGAVDVGAPEAIARAIQKAISISGTKPHWFARQSLPEIRRYLDRFVHEQLFKPI